MFRLAPRIIAAPIARLAVIRAAAPRAVAMRAFSASAIPRMSAGSSDVELHNTLLREIKHEKEQNVDGAVPEFLTEFKSSNKEWTIRDEPRSKEVALVREFGNEKITVLFNTDALDEADEIEQDLEEGEEEHDTERSLPVPVSIIIEKPSNPTAGALEISATIQDGGFFIESADFNATAALAHDATAEGDWTRRSKYAGPFFSNLDEGLQEQFHAYLAERGLGEELAEFVPSYVEYKEQKEYQTWLENVAAFVKN
ncbi:Mitochondrial acidic protein mam33 [Geranomyces michiganensis]|nr:Mitochondrial acidic protein mam33 [Geranomyces michiganensis]